MCKEAGLGLIWGHLTEGDEETSRRDWARNEARYVEVWGYLFRFKHVQTILYLSILLHCIVQWVLQVMSASACCFIVCWFSLSFTTCFGLRGHLQVCRIFICLEDFGSLVTLCMCSICVLFLCCSPSCFWCFLAYALVCLLFIVVVRTNQLGTTDPSELLMSRVSS
jgi:hypothetical protein